MSPNRIRHIFFIIAITCQCLAVRGSLACPANTTALAATALAATASAATALAATAAASATSSSWCLRFYSAQRLNFCDAFRTCQSNGERMIDRPVLDAMRNFGGGIFNTSEYWWVGLTDALNERNSSRDGWVWIGDGRVTTEADGGAYFQTTEPNDMYQQDCVTTVVGSSSHRLRDANCHDTNMFYCYADAAAAGAAAPASTDRTQQFVTSPIATFSQPDPGCWISRRLTTNSSVTACASVCFQYGQFGDCAGFYWNLARLECIILPYFDAAVPLGFANGWEVKHWRKYIVNK